VSHARRRRSIMLGERTSHSRFEVVEVGEEAWAWDENFQSFYFDGVSFWRHDRKHDSYKLLSAWRAPARGWIHADGSLCMICTDDPFDTLAA
jgi:hypothetical protein